jgi:MFS transporter, SP family, general alpha glucoside:H+ symporter
VLDIGFTGTLFAQPAFQKEFGTPYKDGYEISAAWQSGMKASLKIGHIIGVFLDGWFSEGTYAHKPEPGETPVSRLWFFPIHDHTNSYTVIGRKKVSLITLASLAGLIFWQFYSTSLISFLFARMVAGIPLGVFQAAANTYAAEICPVVLRAYLTTYVCLCWVMGQFICAGVTYQLSSRSDPWGWRIIIAVQWAWIPPLFGLLLFAPDSPWWLVRKGRYEDAKKAIRRLTDGSINEENQVAMMKRTTEIEIETKTGSSYLACFKGTNLRRTEIACVVWGIQAGIGNPLQSE